MQITYLHQYFNTPKMSGGTRSFELAKRLVEKGHVVHMITSWRGGDRGSDCFQTNECGIFVYWIPAPYSNHMGYLQRLNAFFLFALKSARVAAKIKADLIFATSTPLTIAFPAVYVARKLSIPMVLEVRDLWPEMPIAVGALKNPILIALAKWLESWAYRNAESIVALSPGMKLGIIKNGFPAERIAIIPNGSDIREFSCDQDLGKLFINQNSWISNRPLLVYAGSFGKVNHVSYAVRLALELKEIKSSICILLVGDGSEKESIVNLAKQLNIFEKNIYFWPNVPKKEIPVLFAAATACLCLFRDIPEMRSNSSNKFFDGLAAGKPIVLNYGGWMHDLVEDYGFGISLWKKSLHDAAKVLDLRMNDKKWLDSAGKYSQGLAQKEFDRDKLALQFEKVLLATHQGNASQSAKIAPGIYSITYA